MEAAVRVLQPTKATMWRQVIWMKLKEPDTYQQNKSFIVQAVAAQSGQA
jgi:hypothetical protein